MRCRRVARQVGSGTASQSFYMDESVHPMHLHQSPRQNHLRLQPCQESVHAFRKKQESCSISPFQAPSMDSGMDATDHPMELMPTASPVMPASKSDQDPSTNPFPIHKDMLASMDSSNLSCNNVNAKRNQSKQHQQMTKFNNSRKRSHKTMSAQAGAPAPEGSAELTSAGSTKCKFCVRCQGRMTRLWINEHTHLASELHTCQAMCSLSSPSPPLLPSQRTPIK